MSTTQRKTGTVAAYDPDSGYGSVEVEGTRIGFHATCFHGGRPARSPREGEPVEVVLDERQSAVEVRSV